MTAHRFTEGTPQERRAWVTEIAREMREEMASHYRVAAVLDRGARDLETCNAEAGDIPVPALAMALEEYISVQHLALLFGMHLDTDVLTDALNARLKELLSEAL
ncbi:MAG TPA: hypothetical protein VGU66_08980 [Candidatus Elarobacter sp.]|nr:hypothetical protein [Candidatus Elarobacter sp.]